VRALLAYLACNANRPQRREALATLLWPELSNRRARRNLRQALFNLRTAIGDQISDPPFLTINRQSVQMNGSGNTWLDAAEFSRRLQTCRGHHLIGEILCDECLQRLERATVLYQGRFLEGLTLDGCQEFNHWSLVEAEHFHLQAIDVQKRLVTAYQQLADINRMGAHAKRWEALDPYDEAAHRAVMLTYALNGQRAAALEKFDAYRKTMLDHLGVEPQVETRELYKRLLDDELPEMLATNHRLNLQIAGHSAECPYQGLSPFSEVDAPFFFGRETFTDRLVQQISTGSNVTAVVGPSGSGKSSVVYAGLLPLIRATGAWDVLIMRPGSDPIQALQRALSDLPESESFRPDDNQGQHQGSPSLHEEIQAILQRNDETDKVLLVVDQFEELFTLCSEEAERRQFLDELLDAVKEINSISTGDFIVLLTLRADFMGQVLAYRAFAEAIQEMTLLMVPMNRLELRAAIEKPARIQGVSFESGLIERLLDDVGDEPGKLPLLEFSLTLLWDSMESGYLSHAAYESIGRVEGALAGYAEDVFMDLDPEEQEAVRRVFVQLVQPGDGTEDTRRVADRSELGLDNWSLLRHLADQRLVVTGRNQDEVETVEIAHEALIQKWDRLQTWIGEDRTFRAWQERLRANLAQWQRSNQDDGALLRGAPLAEAEGWLANHDYELSRPEKEFIRASIDLRERTMERRDRRRRRVMTGLVVGFAITLVLLLLIWNQRQQARLQASIGLASQAITELTGEFPERGVLLALEALENYPYTWQAERALGQAILDGRVRGLLQHDDFVNTAQWSADGTKILTGSSDGSVRIWDASHGEELLTITDGNPTLASWSPDNKHILAVNPEAVSLKVWNVDTKTERFTLIREDLTGKLNINLEQWSPWSPSGDRFLTYGVDGSVKIWDVETGEILKTLGEYSIGTNRPKDLPEDLDKLIHEYYFEEGDKALWSPTGDLIAVSSNEQNQVAVWAVDSGEMNYSFTGGFDDGRVFIGSWSPSGNRFVTRGLGGIKLYDSLSGELLLEMKVPGVLIYRVIWAPDGKRLLTSGIEDGTARVWDTETGEQLSQLPEMVISAGSDWSNDGDIIAVGGNDGLIHIWDVAKGQEIRRLPGTRPRINNVAFSSSGEELLAVGDENIAHIYDLSEATLSIEFEIGPKALISSAVWSPDSQQISLGIGDNTVRVWSAMTGKLQLDFDGHDGVVWMHSWSPSGDHFVTASADHTIIIWDAEKGEKKLVFTGHADEVFGVEWSPVTNQVASNDMSSGQVILWDPDSGKEALSFTGHQDLVFYSKWSPNGKRILSIGAHGEAMIWDAVTGEVYHDLYPEEFQLDIVAGAWSKDGDRVFIQSADGVMRTFDASTGVEISQFNMSRASLSLFSLSPDGTRLLKGGDGGAKVWDLKNGSELLSYDTPGWTDASYSPDGTQILIGSNRGTLEIYPTWNTTQELIDYAKECCLVRELTPEEREMFGLPVERD
jgi:WD40 repeat protein/DNA-binding SARP family transcriptional activator